ncbi:eukaryotic translation initiation factor 4E-binding protein 1 [Lingula anatina]|uniref:Eukaryotic translation initiation factor 4E-binding protein 1 n=1 Tax=Lingula anatina TaxID=7574 RepID=A0A1S3IWT7_LINAN|nr:eukaryotic translation initiation factor 4E-binding protein 1 [Lingula anatina]|eukprot:XP_013402657.1 eukaryotic translation initiation factor 4E-binding protein 1 [Lingula anatina]
MSASPVQRQIVSSQAIPTRRVLLNDPSQLPHDYSTTPGGTLFSTTPGGTRIVYERHFLMQCRNSPLAKSPPPNLPKIPGVTTVQEEKGELMKENGMGKEERSGKENANHKETSGDEPQFHMDI